MNAARLPTLLRLALGLVLSPALVSSCLAARDWHVAADGSDSAAGTSPAVAFRTLKKAASVVQPGDTVLIGDGTYTDSAPGGGSLVTLATSGRADAWITWKPRPGAKPELRGTGWSCVLITGSYQVIEGLTLLGANDSIALADATADGVIKEKSGRKYGGDPRFNTNALFVNGRGQPPSAKPHHIVVRGCTVAKFPGGGLTAIEADYVTFEDNVISGNCWYMRYGGSGISFLNNWAHDDAPGYHNIIRRNRVWDNKTLVPWIDIGKLSDGNGIILDVTNLADNGPGNPAADVGAANPANDPASAAAPKSATPPKPKSLRPEWKGRTLVANNLSAFNGGSGIHTFKTAHADLINNTTCMNGQVVGYPEMFANRSDDIVMLNNVLIPRPDGKVTANSRSTRVRWDYNLYPVEQKGTRGEHDIIADPRVVKIDADIRLADFRLQPGSPGLGTGTDELAQPTDLTGAPRPLGRARSRGAYEP